MSTWPASAQFTAPFSTFTNPYKLDDLNIFDNETLERLLRGLDLHMLAFALVSVTSSIKRRILAHLSIEKQIEMQTILTSTHENALSTSEAQQLLLNQLFWQLTFWHRPMEYHLLTEGESLHPMIFTSLEPHLRNKEVADIGAGSGRATIKCVQHGAKLVYGIDPTPGLLEILQQRVIEASLTQRVRIKRGSFEHLPLTSNSVDVALSCSSFHESFEREEALKELIRITKPSGLIVMIWPYPTYYGWLEQHGFLYKSFPPLANPVVSFRSMEVALRMIHNFYSTKEEEITNYLRETGLPEVPYQMLGLNQPRDLCWLQVKK